MKKIAPSILSADLSDLTKAIRMVELGGADYIHCDVMDGRFVPNLTFGPIIVNAAKKCTSIPLDVHLMIVEPDKHLDAFLDIGIEYLTVHQEASVHLDRTLNYIKSRGTKCGVAINPATPLSSIENVLELADLILIMSVNPGFGGQSFIDYTKKKCEDLATLRSKNNFGFTIEMDGGISGANIKQLADAGCDIFVAGSSVFGSDNPTAETAMLKKIIRN